MSPTTPVTGGSLSPTDRADARAYLAQLRAKLSTFQTLPQVEQVLDGLADVVGQLLVEQDGMADELLGVYEQLGIVFELSHKLPGVQRIRDLVELLVASLQRSFDPRVVLIARRSLSNGWLFQQAIPVPRDWMNRLLNSAAERGRAIVEPAPSEAATDSTREVMVAPVRSGDELVCAVVFFRPDGVPAFRASEMMLVESLATFCGDLIRGRRLVRELQSMSFAVVRSLVNAVDQKDEYTCGHSLRVAFFAVSLGRELGLAESEIQMLQWSALLHDVGKIGIRDDVLKKPGKLTDEEFRHIQEHPVRSHKVVQGIPQLAPALPGILHHHERFDGGGYPSGLKGKNIPRQARIIQIADVFDALTSNRSYRSAYSWTEAVDIMNKEAGRTLDPELVVIFSAWIGRELSCAEDAWERMTQRASQSTELIEQQAEEDEVI